jgi:signal transduction protein with GAF and PtsI domain
MPQTGDTPNTHLALLQRISGIVSSAHDVDSILREMVALTMNITRSDATLVYLIEHSTNEIVLRASQRTHDAEIGKVRMKIGEGITGWVAAHKSVVALAQNAAADSRFKHFSSLQEDSYEAFLSVPLVNGGKIIGVINVQHKEPHRHSCDEVALVAFVGEQMGGVIARARLAERSSHSARRMQTLAAVAQAIGVESYLERILQAISEMLAETMDSAVCSILLVDAEKNEITVSAARCSAPDYMQRMPIRMGGSLIEYVIGQGQPMVVPDIHTEKRYRYPDLARKSGLMSLLAAPLLSQGKAIGCINIYTRDERNFSSDELGFVTVVAGEAALAIQNAQLMSETLEMKRKLEGRKLIERAKGILQHRHNLTEEQAYLRLRDESSRLKRSMRALAEALVLADDLSR